MVKFLMPVMSSLFCSSYNILIKTILKVQLTVHNLNDSKQENMIQL